jgi:hypothetical protein
MAYNVPGLGEGGGYLALIFKRITAVEHCTNVP